MIQHIYPGAWFYSKDEVVHTENTWMPTYNQRYVDMIYENRDRIIIEVAGHDHVEDIRYSRRQDGKSARSLLISNAVTLNNHDLPGFTTFKVENFVPTDLMQYSLDITPSFGMSHIPSFESLSYNVVNYKKDYGLKDLRPKTIEGFINDF